MTNKCIIINEPYKVEIKSISMPIVKKGEALLKIIYGGICGSDLNTYRGTLAYVSYPRIPGHEFSAEILEIEANSKGLEAGMIVTANPYFNCGYCYSCKRGLVNCCTTNQTMGVQREGGFAQYITMPIERLYPVYDMQPKIATLIEPFCISYHGVKRANIKKNEKVLVIGAGTIGILAMATAKIAGAKVYVSDVAQGKLNIAKKLGADGVILNDGQENFDNEVNKITNGNGFDVTIEAVGFPSTFQNCIDASAFGGRIVVIGVGKNNLDFNFTLIQKKELMILGSRNAIKDDFMEVIDVINQKKFNVEQIVTNVYDFQDASKAFEDFDRNAGMMLKVLLKF